MHSNHEDQIRGKAWQLLIRLFREAISDGRIDFDEGRIISSADLNVSNLIQYIKDAWDDKIITGSERANIQFLVKKIEDDAITLAEYDDIITSQEQALLDIIKDIIETFAEQTF